MPQAERVQETLISDVRLLRGFGRSPAAQNGNSLPSRRLLSGNPLLGPAIASLGYLGIARVTDRHKD